MTRCSCLCSSPSSTTMILIGRSCWILCRNCFHSISLSSTSLLKGSRSSSTSSSGLIASWKCSGWRKGKTGKCRGLKYREPLCKGGRMSKETPRGSSTLYSYACEDSTTASSTNSNILHCPLHPTTTHAIQYLLPSLVIFRCHRRLIRSSVRSFSADSSSASTVYPC